VATLKSDAWRALSHGAKALYFAIGLKLDTRPASSNNGKMWLSYREARQILGSGYQEISRWFSELKHYAFIVERTDKKLCGYGRGLSPHLRLTEHKYNGEYPTNDFNRWDGTIFVYQPKAAPRKKSTIQKSDSSATESRSVTPRRKSITPLGSATGFRNIGKVA
jgi:hypothetical protein